MNNKKICGVGYLGVGYYKPTINGKTTIAYNAWRNMIHRCYDKEYQNIKTTYKECILCEEWLNFQNFAKWCDKNYYMIDNEIMNLDKDILCKGNKIYSPETCIFVPQRINKLFIKSNKRRGELPIGVCHTNPKNKFKSYCSTQNKFIYLGNYITPELAFDAYKKCKENVIKEVADEYKNKIPKILYDAMYKYEVEITD